MATYNEIGSGTVYAGGYAQFSEQFAFNGYDKIIAINPGFDTVTIADIYAGWKEWWILHDNAKWVQAMRSTGGDPLPGSEFLGSTFFMTNGWKIKITDAVTVEGNIFDDEGGSPFVTETGIVIATSKVSTLVERVSPPASDNAKIFV